MAMAMTKQPRPFTAIDNPSLSPSYEEYDPDRSFSPSPVQDWQTTLDVCEDPTDHPMPAPSPSPLQKPPPPAAAAAAAGANRDNRRASAAGGNLGDLDSLLIQNSASLGSLGSSYSAAGRDRDWMPNDFDDRAMHELPPKKRRVDQHLQLQQQQYSQRQQMQQRHQHEHMQQRRQMQRRQMQHEQQHQHRQQHQHQQQSSNVHYQDMGVVRMGLNDVVEIDEDGYDDEGLNMSDMPFDLVEMADHEEHAMHPDLNFSYQTHHPEDEELQAHHHHVQLQRQRQMYHAMPPLHVARPLRAHPHAQEHQHVRVLAPVPLQMHMHPHRMHPEEYMMQEMEMPSFPPHPLDRHSRGRPGLPFGAGIRGVMVSPPHARGSPPGVRSTQQRASLPSSAAGVRRSNAAGSPYSRRTIYMNTFVPGMPNSPHSPYYDRATTRYPVSPHPRMFAGENRVFLNPASLPPHRIRKTFHLPPSMEDDYGAQGPYETTQEEAGGEGYTENSFFGGSEVMSGHGFDFDPNQRMMASRRDVLPQEPDMIAAGTVARRQSLPAMKISLPGPPVASTPVVHRESNPVSIPDPASLPASTFNDEENVDGQVVHFNERQHKPLSIEEDVNWLSEFQTFCRAEFMDIFRASHEDVKYRNTSRKVAHKQLGIRCRFCAHLHNGARAKRASAYPSSTVQIYQSFNMMIRDHFPHCEAVPQELMSRFLLLKGKNNQGAADSKHYWSHAAEKLGMVCTASGIYMDEATQLAARDKLPFSTSNDILIAVKQPPILLVAPEDKNMISPFCYELMTRVQRVNLLEVECRSTRKNLKVGLPGFGCQYCCQAGRLGFSRIFPTKRKGLPDKANDMYEHMHRCTLCPREVKDRLEELHTKKTASISAQERVFFDRVWGRLIDPA